MRQLNMLLLHENWGGMEAALRAGADPNERDDEGMPIIERVVARRAPIDTVEALIRHGADVNAASPEDGSCALLSCVGQNGAGLERWVPHDDLPLVKLLITAGADVNSHYTDRTVSALMVAARCGSLEIIALLLDNGADLAYRNEADCTALHWAVSASWLDDRPEVVALLLARGADKHARTIHGHTPADYARMNGHTKSLVLLA